MQKHTAQVYKHEVRIVQHTTYIH